MTAPETARLFFALWPDDGLRERIGRLREGLAVRGRAVGVENLHVTLCFAGSVTAEKRRCLEACAAAVHGAPFTLVLDRLGYWVRPRILWLGSSETPPALAELARELNQALGECDLVPDRRPYVPHMTLYRKAVHAPGIETLAPMAWPVSRFVLLKSELGRGGSGYSVVRSWSLEG